VKCEIKNVQAKKGPCSPTDKYQEISGFLGKNFNTNRMEVNWNQFISCHTIRILKSSGLGLLSLTFLQHLKKRNIKSEKHAPQSTTKN